MNSDPTSASSETVSSTENQSPSAPAIHPEEVKQAAVIEAIKLERAYWTSIGCKFGDTAGFMNGAIEFNYSTEDIHHQYWQGEPPKLLKDLATKHFLYSDDTVFSDMTKSVLRNKKLLSESTSTIVTALVTQYVKYKEDPHYRERAHGNTMRDSLSQLEADPSQWPNLPYKTWKTGCGAAMRTMPIGEAFSGEANRKKLLEVALASSYATHTNPKGFLGGVASAAFTAFACENKPFSQWVPSLLQMINPISGNAFLFAQTIVKPAGYEKAFTADWHQFEQCCKYYFNHRFSESGKLV